MKPFWKTNIMVIDFIFQFIFIFIIIYLLNLLKTHTSTNTILVIFSVFFYVALGIVRIELLRRGIVYKKLGNTALNCTRCDRHRDPDCMMGITCEEEGETITKLDEKWWHSYAGDMMFGLTIPMLLIICLINKKYNYYSLLMAYIVIYFSTNSSYKCIYYQPFGNLNSIGLAISVYIILLLQYPNNTSKRSHILFPLITTILLIISYIFRGVLGGVVNYMCI